MYFTGLMEYVLFYWSLHDMLKMYCLHAFFVVFYLLVLGQKWPNKYVQTYSPYKPFNHNLYIGIIIFPHIDNPQSTGYN